MLIIGVTGGIASGKSSVVQYFDQLGISAIDADIVAREIVKPGDQLLIEIVEHFGERVLKKEGTLDRVYLRKLIFENANERLWLEQRMHPAIFAEIKIQLPNLKGPYCLLIVPLLLRAPYYLDMIDRMLLIDCTQSKQMERLIVRDQIDETMAKAIIASQPSRQELLAAADDVIYNESDQRNLFLQVQKYHQFYLELAKKKIA